MKTAYQEGQEAAREGKDIRDNPYDPIETDWGHEDWTQGYEAEKSGGLK